MASVPIPEALEVRVLRFPHRRRICRRSRLWLLAGGAKEAVGIAGPGFPGMPGRAVSNFSSGLSSGGSVAQHALCDV
eukprot:7474316-Alexandrium_andersonii.AAC.1